MAFIWFYHIFQRFSEGLTALLHELGKLAIVSDFVAFE
jgi:hypothetical protein